MKILLTNAQIVNDGKIIESDLLIKDGRIHNIAPSLSAPNAKRTIDAKGKLLLPGMIDSHVHCREPGLTHKGDLSSETQAAVAGGVTSIMEMPNTIPAVVSEETLEKKFELAAQKSHTNYSFYMGASNNNLETLKKIDRQKVCGIKLFMGASTGNLFVDENQALENIFSQIDLPIAVHCEESSIIEKNQARLQARFGDDIPFHFHPVIRSEEACYTSTQKAVELATRHKARLHVLHVTTAKELDLFEIRTLSGKKITAEACPHHLWFTELDYEAKGALIKCNPAIKTKEDLNALRAAVRSGLIDSIGTDHAPHLFNEKQQPYTSAPSGMPSLQSALPSLLENFPPELVAEKTAHNPATIFNIQERGYIREGYWADLVLIDPDHPHTVAKENILYACKWSPFEGTRFKSSIITTLINGEIAYENSAIQPYKSGKKLLFNRYP